MVHLGMFFWGLEQGAEVLGLGRDVVATLPADASAAIVGMNAPPAPFVPEQLHRKPGYALLVVGFGKEDEHARIMARIRAASPALFEFVTPMPYTQLQQIIDEDSR